MQAGVAARTERRVMTSPADIIRKVTDREIWRRSIDRLLSRAGVDGSFFEAYDCPAPRLPEGALDYLQPSNPRLLELQERYSRLNIDAVHPSQWGKSYVQEEIPLRGFRGETGFLWQHRDFNLPTNYLLTYYYLIGQGHRSLLSLLTEDDLFGIYGVKAEDGLLTRDRLDSASEVAFLRSTLPAEDSDSLCVLDIGAGYGRLAHRLTQAFSNCSVLCADAIPESSFLCEYYLDVRECAPRARMIPLDTIEDVLATERVNLAVNVHSFSECTPRAVAWWIRLLAAHSVPYLFIVPDSNCYTEKALICLDADGSRVDFEPLLGQSGYRRILCAPKYLEPNLQRFGLSPTHYFLYGLSC
jgi:hypothetical protein